MNSKFAAYQPVRRHHNHSPAMLSRLISAKPTIRSIMKTPIGTAISPKISLCHPRNDIQAADIFRNGTPVTNSMTPCINGITPARKKTTIIQDRRRLGCCSPINEPMSAINRKANRKMATPMSNRTQPVSLTEELTTALKRTSLPCPCSIDCILVRRSMPPKSKLAAKFAAY